MLILVVVVIGFFLLAQCGGGLDVGGGGGTGGGGGGGVGPRTDLVQTQPINRDEMPAAERQAMDDAMSTGVTDVNDYWAAVYEDVWGRPYDPPSSAFAFDPDGNQRISCGQPLPNDILRNNAIYCPPEDYITWDARYLIPKLTVNFGRAAPLVVLAHEWGHAVQTKAGVGGPTILKELQADCLAGAWVQSVQNGESETVGPFSNAELDGSVAGFLLLRDPPGTDPLAQGAHGSGFDRIRAFEDGIQQGPTVCANYELNTDSPRITPLEFTADDSDTGGNLPLDDSIDVVVAGLNAFWGPELEQAFGEAQLGLDEYRSTDRGIPSCPGVSQDEGGPIFYCSETGTISYDYDTIAAVHADIGDFAIALLFAREYGNAILDIEGARGDGAQLDISGHCLAGVWSRAVYDGNLQIDTAADGEPLFLELSAGDLDEALAVMLRFRSPREDATLFERTDGFGDGFFDGEPACGL